MGRKAYETDLSNAEWRKVEMLIPPAKPGFIAAQETRH
jgi:transposase